MLKLLATLFLIALVVAALHFRWDLFRLRFHPWLKRNATLLGAYRSLGWLLTVPLLLVGGYLGFLQLHDALDPPDVALVFQSPDSPRFWIVNSSSKLVREPKYQFLLYDLSLGGNQELFLNLEIPVKTLGFIRPGQGLGPWTIKSVARQGGRIEKNHHLFGYADVQCPTCERRRFYWIFVHVGHTGWYAEIPFDETKSILRDLDAVVHGGPDYLRKISKIVPVSRRISMEEPV